MLNAMDTRGNKRTTFIVVMDTATVWDTFDPRGNIYEKRSGRHLVLPQKRMVDFLASYFASHDETSNTVWDGRHGGME